jgi:chitodextrinase
MNASPDGENTLLFKPLSGWIAPDDMTITVVRDITNSFNASYERLTSDVSIQVQPPSAWWTLTDADGGTHTGMGNMALAGIPTGEATITWGEIEGFETPQPNPGVYTVEAGETLVISGEYVEAIVTADFSAFPLLGAPPLEVNFTDLSDSTTKDIVEWRWYFGDGRTSSERNPSHVYREPGTYTVTLSVTTMEQMNVISKKSYITVTAGLPVAGGAGLILVAAAFVLSGMRLLNKRTR